MKQRIILPTRYIILIEDDVDQSISQVQRKKWERLGLVSPLSPVPKEAVKAVQEVLRKNNLSFSSVDIIRETMDRGANIVALIVRGSCRSQFGLAAMQIVRAYGAEKERMNGIIMNLVQGSGE